MSVNSTNNNHSDLCLLRLDHYIPLDMCSRCVVIASMVLECCVTELEDVAGDREALRNAPQPVMQESPHPYTDNVTLSGGVKIPGNGLLVTA